MTSCPRSLMFHDGGSREWVGFLFLFFKHGTQTQGVMHLIDLPDRVICVFHSTITQFCFVCVCVCVCGVVW